MLPEGLDSALKRLRETVRAERYLVAWRKPGEQKGFSVVSAFGIDPESLWVSEAVSISLLEEVLQTGEPRWSDQDQTHEGSLTFLLAGIKSYVCVPIKFPVDQGIALLYADDRKNIAHFNFTDFTNVLNLARRLAYPGEGTNRMPPSPIPPPPPRPSVTLEGSQGKWKLKTRHQIAFFRSMATFIQSGIPVLHALHALGQQGESRELRGLCQDLHRYLCKGNALSEGCKKLARFSPMVLYMLTSAENSGQLAEVLGHLAQFLEESYNRRQRVRHALVYPCLILVACLGMAIALPTFILRDQLQTYATMGALPLPTQVLLWVGNTARSPFPWLALPGICLSAPWWVPKILHHPRFRYALHRFLLANPITHRTYCAWQEVSLATSLGLQMRAGVSILSALDVAVKVGGSPLLEEYSEALLEKVRFGDTLSTALMQAPGIGKPFCQMLVAGEESGHVVRALDWVGQSAKLEFDHTLDTTVQLIEPLMMLLMGLLVGFVTLGTLLPSLRMLDNL